MLIPVFLVSALILGGTRHHVFDSRTSQKPDFTGIWNARVIPPADASVEGLKISYDDPELKIWRTRTPKKAFVVGQSTGAVYSPELVYYTDGRGERQKPLFGSSEEKSKTERIGEKFVTTSSYKSKALGKTIIRDLTATLEVSADGTTLTETLTAVSEGNTKRIVRLYNRVDKNNGRDINGEWVRRISNRVVSLVVEHRDPEIKVTRRVISEALDESETSIYYTDGRGEINVKDGLRVKSLTKWKDDDVVFTISSTSSIAGDEIGVEEWIKWQIAKDGGSLVEATEVKRSSKKGAIIPGLKTTQLVYARSEKPLPPTDVR